MEEEAELRVEMVVEEVMDAGRRSTRRPSVSATSMAVRVAGDQWVHAFKSAMRSANPGVLVLMNEAEKMTTEAKDDNLDLTMTKEEVKKMSGVLYNILSQYCTGEALTIVRGRHDI